MPLVSLSPFIFLFTCLLPGAICFRRLELLLYFLKFAMMRRLLQRLLSHPIPCCGSLTLLQNHPPDTVQKASIEPPDFSKGDWRYLEDSTNSYQSGQQLHGCWRVKRLKSNETGLSSTCSGANRNPDQLEIHRKKEGSKDMVCFQRNIKTPINLHAERERVNPLFFFVN